MPGPNPTTTKRRREYIARGIVAGKTRAQIGRELGISQPAVSQQVARPETQALIKAWMEPHHAALRKLIPKAIETVREGMYRNNQTRDRLRAVRELGTILGWAEGRTDGSDSGQVQRSASGTMEELLVLYRRMSIDTSAPGESPAETP